MTDKTLRDEFAMAALKGLIINGSIKETLLKRNYSPQKITGNIALVAYRYADAMLKAREQNSGGE